MEFQKIFPTFLRIRKISSHLKFSSHSILEFGAYIVSKRQRLHIRRPKFFCFNGRFFYWHQGYNYASESTSFLLWENPYNSVHMFDPMQKLSRHLVVTNRSSQPHVPTLPSKQLPLQLPTKLAFVKKLTMSLIQTSLVELAFRAPNIILQIKTSWK